MNNGERPAGAPALRFPGFVGPVGFVNGNELFEPVSNRDHPAGLPVLAVTQEHGAVPRESIDYNVSVSEKSLESYKTVEIGDFIISLRSFQGGIEYSLCRGICSPAYIVLRGKPGLVGPYYRYYFKTNRFILDLNRDLEGIRDGKMVSYGQFSAIRLPLPPEREQRKVAACLASLDDLIDAEKQKLGALRAHKRGLLQALFPAAGKTVPERRFPEFRGLGGWEQATVGSLVTPVTPPKKLRCAEYRREGRFPVIDQSQAAICGWTDDPGAVVSDGLPLLIFGDHTGALKLADRPFAQGADNIKILSVDERVEPAFLYQYLQARPVKIESYKRHFSVLKETAVLFPPRETGEQRKIAACLAGADDLLAAQSARIEALKLHKRGLMQGLFPSGEEANIV